jgi:heme-degrading monooxygenase HmoA
MIAVIFEVEPEEERMKDYLNVAADLRPLLDELQGFISVERFESLTQPGKLVSLSFWDDETAVKRWRNTEEHRQAQAAGRAGILRSYRLRVADVLRDYGSSDRAGAPADSLTRHGGDPVG